jgi:hypothetical protein
VGEIKMIDFKKDFSDQLTLLENVIEDNIYINNYMEYSKWIVSIEHMDVIVFGDKYSPKYEYIDMADRILKDFDRYINLAIDRFKHWLGYDASYVCISMEFGQIYYSDTRLWENSFSLTFTRQENIKSEWKYTAKFKGDGWPIGIEVWSEKRCSELEGKHWFIDFDEDETSDPENEKFQKELMKFFIEHVKSDGKYYVNEAICSRYCGTRITSNYFYAIGIDQDTGNSVNDLYSNYTVKYMNKNEFFPISIEFWIS